MFLPSCRKVEKLVRLVEESNIDELEDNFGWGIFKTGVRIRKSTPEINQRAYAGKENIIQIPEKPKEPEQVNREENYVLIKSPMVGTFYNKVKVGKVIEIGQVVCTIKAMKLDNQIESKVAGRVDEICVEDEKPVEFDQTLYRIDSSDYKK